MKRREARPLLVASAGLVLTLSGCVIGNPLPPDMTAIVVSNPFIDLGHVDSSPPPDLADRDAGSTD